MKEFLKIPPLDRSFWLSTNGSSPTYEVNSCDEFEGPRVGDVVDEAADITVQLGRGQRVGEQRNIDAQKREKVIVWKQSPVLNYSCSTNELNLQIP